MIKLKTFKSKIKAMPITEREKMLGDIELINRLN